MAFVSLLGLMLLLVLADLTGMVPWQDDSVEPRLVLPVFEAAVDDAVAMPSDPVAFVADAAVAPVGAGSPSLAARQPSGGGTSEAMPAVGPARAVAVTAPSTPAPAPESETGDEVPSDGATTVEAPPGGTSLPVSTPASPGGGGPARPVASGGPVLESCEGDEYVITIVLAPDAEEGEEASVEIVLQRFNEDGGVDELQLEGDLLDAENLAVQLSSEGNCVIVEASEPEGTESDEGSDADPAEEAVAEPGAP